MRFGLALALRRKGQQLRERRRVAGADRHRIAERTGDRLLSVLITEAVARP